MGFNNVTGPLLLEFYTCSQGSVIELITLSIGQMVERSIFMTVKLLSVAGLSGICHKSHA